VVLGRLAAGASLKNGAHDAKQRPPAAILDQGMNATGASPTASSANAASD
jgi:hypothetical protein